jgi:hypothetical protein
MSLNVSSAGDNPQQPSITAQLYIPDQLICGPLQLVTTPITLDAGTLKRGTVLGQKTIGAAVAAAKQGGNTGTGTLVMDVATPILANAEPGVYTVTCTVAGANSATFRVVSPKGAVLGDVAFNGAGASATFADRIKFTVTDAGVDFIVGDAFTVTVAAGNMHYVQSVATATDGSQNPCAILADDADASGGAVATGAYLMGEFNSNAITFDNSWSVATLTPILRTLSIFLKTFVSAAPET